MRSSDMRIGPVSSFLVAGLMLLGWAQPAKVVAQPIVGEIRAFALDPSQEPGKTAYSHLADQGWMECKGQELPIGPSNPYYKKIFDALGTTWGTGSVDPARPTSFHVPDLRGEFLRGWDHGRGRDLEASMRILPLGHKNEPTDKVGTSQDDKVRQNVSITSTVHNTTRGFDDDRVNPVNRGTIAELRLTGVPIQNEAQIAIAGRNVGKETTPDNVYIFYAIYVGVKVLPVNR